MSLQSQPVPQIPGAIFPYFTQVDPELNRESAGRDPLGLLPVWSAIGRELVPNLASPVLQANGIRAVLLIHWLGERPRLQELLTNAARQRGFIRLMEGVIEYWLKQSGLPICYGSQALLSGGTAFTVSARSGKTVVNGLHQYYRGSCERAGLVDDDWRVDASLGDLFECVWNDTASAVLAKELAPFLEGGQLLAAQVTSHKQISAALQAVYNDQAVTHHLRGILGEHKYRALAGDFADLRHRDLSLRERARLLTSEALSGQIEDMHRCEPFLLVLQDSFDIVRAAANEHLTAVTERIASALPQMRQRANDFSALAGKISKAGPARRMRELQRLAALLVSVHDGAAHATLNVFLRELVRYHGDCMVERARDPLVVLEGHLIAVHGGEGGRADKALRRLASDDPDWDNDYYLHAASTIYQQLHGERP
ncbi:hypothetical protein ASR47_1006224 [Janthinobacterium psychrotolerans]|uniref:Uncharacterized protein n=1 Tax=Janthinobacterium psychrotolerans TaxID=1747903 RepID=A0A1A7C0U1_9BURK|nr:hypothetical protein ASR47_1006224 [Janthinobacterium psychrotolerans]